MTTIEIDSKDFDWHEIWYPVHYLEDLSRDKPNRFKLLERDIVIWWDGGNWRVFDDICPHRLALLSEGRINSDGNLECPYHGWSFNGTGECINIPQEPQGGKAKESPRACTSPLPTQVKQGLLFVYAGKSENALTAKIPIVDQLEEDPQSWTIINTFRDLPFNSLTVLENVLDSSHVPFTHHGTIGKRENAAPVELQVTQFNRDGFSGIWQEGPRKGTLGTQYTQFIAPLLMWHDLTSKQFGRTLTVVYVTPISKGKCRIFARFPFQFNSKIPEFFIKLTPRWYSHINQNRILEDDQIFLHYQERFLDKLGANVQAFYLPTKADIYVSKLHQWIDQYSLDPFAGESLPPPLEHHTLLERYHAHTENCHSCSRALANIRKSRKALLIIGTLLWLTVEQADYFSLLVKAVFVLLAITIWFYLSKLEHDLIQGEETPTRNLKVD